MVGRKSAVTCLRCSPIILNSTEKSSSTICLRCGARRSAVTLGPATLMSFTIFRPVSGLARPLLKGFRNAKGKRPRKMSATG